jgi:hypothetical protein
MPGGRGPRMVWHHAGMDLLRRMVAWFLILGGGVVLCSLALALVVDRPEGNPPLAVKAVLVMGFMLGVCPIVLGSIMRRKPHPRAVQQPPVATPVIAAESMALPAHQPPGPASADPDAIHCQVTLTERDLVSFQYWYFTQRSWRMVVGITAGCAIVGTMMLIRASASGAQGSGWNVVSAFLAVALFLGIMGATPYWSGRRMYRRAPTLAQPTSYSFSSSRIHLWTNDCDLTCQWSTLSHAYESRHAVYLQIQEQVFRLLPKSAFADGDLARLAALLSSRLDDRWHPLPGERASQRTRSK